MRCVIINLFHIVIMICHTLVNTKIIDNLNAGKLMIEFIDNTQTHNTAIQLLMPSKFKWAVTQVFSYLLGEHVSRTLLPAQLRSEDADDWQSTYQYEQRALRKLSTAGYSNLQSHKFHLQTTDGALLETIELKHQTQERKAVDQRKYAIYLVGNGMCYQDVLSEILLDARDLEINALAFNYRNVMDSSGTLTQYITLVLDVISQIERLKQNGISPDNIYIIGHSFGAAIGTIAAYVYASLNENVKLLNGRSFGSSNEFLYYLLPEGWQRTINGSLQDLALNLTGWNFSPAEFFALIPAANKRYIVIKNASAEDDCSPDGVIAHPASLHKGLKRFLQAHPEYTTENPDMICQKVLSFNRLFGFGHNDPMRTLQCVNSEENARDYYRRFIME